MPVRPPSSKRGRQSPVRYHELHGRPQGAGAEHAVGQAAAARRHEPPPVDLPARKDTVLNGSRVIAVSYLARQHDILSGSESNYNHGH